MTSDPEYLHVLTHLYEKSLIHHDTSLFDKTLYFYFVDAIAHIDYTCSIYTFNYQSPKNIMGAEYMRWRIDEEKKGDRVHFPAFMVWLKEHKPEKFARLPTLWQIIYDPEDSASYRSFRIVPDPDSKQAIPPGFFINLIDEFFDQDFLKSLYEEASLSRLFAEFLSQRKTS
jgi:hypothetical protein